MQVHYTSGVPLLSYSHTVDVVSEIFQFNSVSQFLEGEEGQVNVLLAT